MSPKKFKVIAVDDHPIVLSGLKLFFQEEEMFQLVGFAGDSREMFEILESTEADTLLLDLNLPGTDIHRLIKELIVKYPWLKVLAYTNYDHPKLIKTVLEYGLSGYLVKDVTPDELFEAIRTVHRGQTYICEELKSKVQGRGKNPHLSSRTEGDGDWFDDGFMMKVNLTDRERDVITLIAQGYTNKEIAHQLYLSKYTIETHRKNILKKLKFKSSADLVRFAANHGLV